MKTLYVIGLAQFLYGLASAKEGINKVVLVEIKEFNPTGGNRPFQETANLMSDLCYYVGLEFSVEHIDDLRSSNSRHEGDYVDLGIIARLKDGYPFNKPEILAVQVEHLNLMRPTVKRFFSYEFRKRLDLNKRLLFCKGISSFYTLSLSPIKNYFFQEKEISRNSLELVIDTLIKGLIDSGKYDFLINLRKLAKNKVLVIFTLPNHFGGNESFNERLIRLAVEIGNGRGIKHFLIKNHPSDAFNFQNLHLDVYQTSENEFFFLNSARQRVFPMEILIHCLGPHLFVGALSTSFFVFSKNQIDNPLIVEDKNRRSSRHRNYDLGSAPSSCGASLMLI